MPELFNNDSIEQWEVEGSIETPERAMSFAKSLLDDYEEPMLDPGVNEALLERLGKR